MLHTEHAYCSEGCHRGGLEYDQSWDRNIRSPSRRLATNAPMEQWESQYGVGLLRSLGVRPGDRVLDFGCGVGHYSIPAAFAVGNSGVVYALDKDQEPLDQLTKRAKLYGLSNIKPVKTSDGVEINMPTESIDVVLLYDVLHYFTERNRRTLYQETSRVLTSTGLLSVYPKHTAEDTPAKEFKDVHLSDVKREIQICGFEPDGCWAAVISHDGALERGHVLNFRKYKRVW